jgi:hypothetical protein
MMSAVKVLAASTRAVCRQAQKRASRQTASPHSVEELLTSVNELPLQ